MKKEDIKKANLLNSSINELEKFKDRIFNDYPNVGKIMYVDTNPNNGIHTPTELILSPATRIVIDMLVKHDLNEQIKSLEEQIAEL